MHKVHKSLHTLVEHVITNIANTHDIDVEALTQTVAPLLQREENVFVRCKGLVASKNNLPVCRCRVVKDTDFCRRHTPVWVDESLTSSAKTQCTAHVNNGTRCLKNAKFGHEICGTHLIKQLYRQRQEQNDQDRLPCIHYEENEDHDDQDFCNRSTPHKDTWFCIKHAHMQSMYERLYGAKSVSDYQTNGTRQIPLVDNFIKDNRIDES